VIAAQYLLAAPVLLQDHLSGFVKDSERNGSRSLPSSKPRDHLRTQTRETEPRTAAA
jgi:hypothetical protein